MAHCFFCSFTAAGSYALTACDGEPDDTASWHRFILPTCERCRRVLAQARDEGRVDKRARTRWFLGHVTGRFEAVQFRSGGEAESE